VDERKIEELFRDAAQGAPPPSFDEHDVIRASRRVTARRRIAAASGSLVAAAVLVGGIGFGTGVFGGTGGSQVASAPDSHSPSAQDKSGPSIMSEPDSRRGQCAAPDEQLASALVEKVPEAGKTTPVPARGGCPSGSRNAAFAVREGASAGTVAVVLSPAGTVPPEQLGVSQRPDGARQVSEEARSGKVLTVVSDPDADSPGPPYGDRLIAIAGDLAARF
jgi:hypothetical protein